MLYIYRILIHLVDLLLPIAGLFVPKIKRMLAGRKESVMMLKGLPAKDKGVRRIWLHCASLGEFEQGRPVVEALLAEDKNTELYVSFFSPSGYEVKKNYALAKNVFYLPSDTSGHARLIMERVQPDLILFVKYEVWYEYMKIALERKVPVYLISAVFLPQFFYFSWYGVFWRNLLKKLDQIFLQDLSSYEVLKEHGFKNIVLAGDTRYDNVMSVANQEYDVSLINEFKTDKKVLILGSAWDAELDLVYQYMVDENGSELKYIIAPHDLKYVSRIEEKCKEMNAGYLLFSKLQGYENVELEKAQVLIVDTIGQLSRLYRVGDIALVGGGFRDALHNILEPAVYGLPVMCGGQTTRFHEAQEMEQEGVLTKISSVQELQRGVELYLSGLDEWKIKQRNYIAQRLGATNMILSAVSKRFS